VDVAKLNLTNTSVEHHGGGKEVRGRA